MPSRFLNNITVNDSYTLPSADGSVDQVITTDGAGNLSFIDVNSVIDTATGEVYYTVKNSTGSTLLKGKAVMAVGSDGNSGHILVDEMIADGSVESKYFLGVLAENIGNGNTGKAIHFGQIGQFNTNGQNGETWSDGQVLWCDPSNPGDYTITEPNGPNVKIAAAIILKASTNGKIQVRVQANEGIHDLHDTKITSQVDGDVLVWDNTTGVWFNDSTLNVDYTAGNVGIGTTSPATTLEVSQVGTGGISGQVLAEAQGANGNAGYGFRTNGTTRWNISTIGTDGSNNLRFYDVNNSTERMRITSSGNVGIGTTSPTNGILQIGDSNTATTIAIAGPRTKFGYNGTNAIVQGGSSKGVAFCVNNATLGSGEAMRITSSGNVGIGTTSPSKKLDVSGDWILDGITGGHFENYTYGSQLDISELTSGGWARANRIATSDSDAYVFSGVLGDGTTLTRAYWTIGSSSDAVGFTYSNGINLLKNGNVGIGTTTPSYKLDVTGEGRFTGDVRGLSFITTSQRDQKEDITDITKTKAKTIPFKEYTYKSSIDGSSRKRYGVVAEDIENDYPELVYTGVDGIKGVNYIDLLVKRVAELEKELEDISLTPGATGPQGPSGSNGNDGNNHLENVNSIVFNEKSGQLEITIEGYKSPFKFNPAK